MAQRIGVGPGSTGNVQVAGASGVAPAQRTVTRAEVEQSLADVTRQIGQLPWRSNQNPVERAQADKLQHYQHQLQRILGIAPPADEAALVQKRLGELYLINHLADTSGLLGNMYTNALARGSFGEARQGARNLASAASKKYEALLAKDGGKLSEESCRLINRDIDEALDQVITVGDVRNVEVHSATQKVTIGAGVIISIALFAPGGIVAGTYAAGGAAAVAKLGAGTTAASSVAAAEAYAAGGAAAVAKLTVPAATASAIGLTAVKVGTSWALDDTQYTARRGLEDAVSGSVQGVIAASPLIMGKAIAPVGQWVANTATNGTMVAAKQVISSKAAQIVATQVGRTAGGAATFGTQGAITGGVASATSELVKPGTFDTGLLAGGVRVVLAGADGAKSGAIFGVATGAVANVTGAVVKPHMDPKLIPGVKVDAYGVGKPAFQATPNQHIKDALEDAARAAKSSQRDFIVDHPFGGSVGSIRVTPQGGVFFTPVQGASFRDYLEHVSSLAQLRGSPMWLEGFTLDPQSVAITAEGTLKYAPATLNLSTAQQVAAQVSQLSNGKVDRLLLDLSGLEGTAWATPKGIAFTAPAGTSAVDALKLGEKAAGMLGTPITVESHALHSNTITGPSFLVGPTGGRVDLIPSKYVSPAHVLADAETLAVRTGRPVRLNLDGEPVIVTKSADGIRVQYSTEVPVSARLEGALRASNTLGVEVEIAPGLVASDGKVILRWPRLDIEAPPRVMAEAQFKANTLNHAVQIEHPNVPPGTTVVPSASAMAAVPPAPAMSAQAKQIIDALPAAATPEGKNALRAFLDGWKLNQAGKLGSEVLVDKPMDPGQVTWSILHPKSRVDPREVASWLAAERFKYLQRAEGLHLHETEYAKRRAIEDVVMDRIRTGSVIDEDFLVDQVDKLWRSLSRS